MDSTRFNTSSAPIVVNKKLLKKCLPPKRTRRAHKKSFGLLQICAGSKKYPGAAILVSLGALKAGCGYIHLQSPVSNLALLKLPELIPGWNKQASAVVIGPGLSTSMASKSSLKKILHQIPSDTPVLIDASALPSIRHLSLKNRPIVLTPHEGEAAKILGIKKLSPNRLQTAYSLLKKFPEAVVLLKGFRTLIVSQKGAFIVPWGSVAMANAGQGDLLSGVIGAYLALGMEPLKACIAAASICALCADKLSKKRIPQGVLAHEIASEIPQTLKNLYPSSSKD